MKMSDRTLQDFTALATRLSDIGRPHWWDWWEHLPQGEALYIEFTNNSPHSEESIREWAKRIATLFSENGVTGPLEIDVAELLAIVARHEN